MAKAIMIQGTMSNAGKSLFAAGLCRIIKQDGHRVAPFKSQNMALNSFVTREGAEMGRAQVVQAEAAGIEPNVMMNPILLKPTSDRGAQVIVNGKVLGNMEAAQYLNYKTKLVPDILDAYHTLDREFDILVLEGAGSPAEINLQSRDIVNMGMAKMAKAPVLLIADIDRGGVFAAIYGTVKLLPPDEQNIIKGIVINKFRGDVEILKPGLKMIEEKTNIPVVGVVPYLAIDIEDEDSLAERIEKEKSISAVDIAIIRLPRMSNFTDFNVFELIPEVSVRYVKNVSELKQPDMIILPGTKNTMGDLIWLRQSGLEAEIKKQAAQGAVIFGVCGGYQMLGKTLADPCNVEYGGTLRGMELLNMETVFLRLKTRTQVTGRFKQLKGVMAKLSNLTFSGYEIHLGVTHTVQEDPLVSIECISGNLKHKTDGIIHDNVMGSYVHGIFDQEGVATTIVECLLDHKGMEASFREPINYKEYKEYQYDFLAESIRKSVDMEAIYRIMEEGV